MIQFVSEESSSERGNAKIALTNYRITVSVQIADLYNFASNFISVTKGVRTTRPFKLA